MEVINSRLDEVKDQINDLENKIKENTHSEQQKEKRIFKNKETLKNIWDNMEHTNLCTMGIPEGTESEQGINNLFEEIMTEKFPTLEKQNVSLVQEFRESPKSWTQRGLHRHTS